MDEDLEKIQKMREHFGKIMDKVKAVVDMGESEQKKFISDLRKGLQSTSMVKNFVVLISLVLLVFSILVFFGYKLYKSLVEKERKREEKRKIKQMKKKK